MTTSKAEITSLSQPQAKRLNVCVTSELPCPNEYVLALNGEYRDYAFDEVRAPRHRGRWRADLFGVDANQPLDLEIGTGNGLHFAHYAALHPERALVGIEVKYKPLIQSIRRALARKSKNARILRYDASLVDDLFEDQELDNVFIHFPDPWPKKRGWKHRLIQDEFLKRLYRLQRPGATLDFKTDSECYFDWACERFARSSYKTVAYSRDLHKSELASENFVTQFENIFLRKGQPIFFTRLQV